MQSDLYSGIEQKFVFQEPQKNILLEWLMHCCVPDTQFNFGRVSSIYYDTPMLALYYEKRSSDYLKSKVRLRWYEQPSSSCPDHKIQSYLEVKRKCGTLRQKERLPVLIPAKTLIDDPFSDKGICNMPLQLYQLHYNPPGLLVPILIIQYKRCRFIDAESGSRIALDTDIQCVRTNTRYITGLPPIKLGAGVLEVKGSLRQLPNSIRSIEGYLTKESFSKYGMCCEHLMQPLGRRI